MQKLLPAHIIFISNNCRIVIASLIVLLFLTIGCRSGNDSRKKIIIEADISEWFHRELEGVFTVKEEISLRYHPFPLKGVSPDVTIVEERAKEGKVRWEIYTDQSINLYPPLGTAVIMHPGDSMHILYKENYLRYSGSNTKVMELVDTLSQLTERVLKPFKKYSYKVSSLSDYQDWNRYLDEKIALSLPILEYFRSQITPAEYEFYKSNLIGSLECNRVDAFCALQRAVGLGNESLNKIDLMQIWDSTQHKSSRQWLNGLSEYNGSIYDVYTFTWMELNREAGFDRSNDSIRSKEVYTRALYNKAKQQYRGQLRERLLGRILEEEVILEMGLKNPSTQAMLQDYYNQPGYPEFKAWIKEKEKKRQERELEKEKKVKQIG